jgi:hypothetical protein
MQPDTQSARPPAVTLEEHHPLHYIGEEALAPDDKGLVPDEDQNPGEDLPSEQLAAEASEDMVFSPEETEQ